MRYDITMPLLDGRVTVDGIKLNPIKTASMIYEKNPQFRAGNFGLWDLNLGYFLPAIEAGWELIGLPIFPKRNSTYQFIFCREDSGIESPKDLEGKRIGTTGYIASAVFWARGLLKHRHGVNMSKVRWITQRKETFPIYDRELKIEYIDSDKGIVHELMNGKVDAIITNISDAKLFNILENSREVRRLFPNYMEEDEKLYRETGIFTPMHIIVMSRKLNREHPNLAGKLYMAFEYAKMIAYDDILSHRAGFSVVYLRERMKEQVEKWGDPWKYGMKANKSTIDALVHYSHEQGLTQSVLPLEKIFAEGTLET